MQNEINQDYFFDETLSFYRRHLSEVVESQEKEKVSLSVTFIIAYLAYLLLGFVLVKFVSKYDLILGTVRTLLKLSNISICGINTFIVAYLCYFILFPFLIAGVWAASIYGRKSENESDAEVTITVTDQIEDSVDDNSVIAASIILMIMFSTFVILGGVVWYGAKWYVSKIVIICFALGASFAWLFTFAVTLTNDNYTYSGVSAIILATNFIPACYISQKKTIWKDLPLFTFFRNLAKSIASQTEQEHNSIQGMTPVEKRKHADTTMQQTVSQITEDENSRLKVRFTIASVLYLALMVFYTIIFLSKEDDQTIRGLAILNPLFILASDIVIISLRQQAVQISQKEHENSNMIYSPTFQSVILLFNRVLLCYNKEYWLINYAFVYFIVQSICSYDATQTVFLHNSNSGVHGDQDNIIEILRICPVLQAKIQNQLPELKTDFPYVPVPCCCNAGDFCRWHKIRTQVASLIYFVFFTGLNMFCEADKENFQTKRITFKNEVGQWVYGYLAISASIVIAFYILWYRAFKNSGYVISLTSLLLYLLFQGVSMAVGFFFYKRIDLDINIILTSFVFLPIIIVSFSSFYGIWVSNDYNGYEQDYLKANQNNLQPEQVEAYKNMGNWEKMKEGAWKPRSQKDCMFFFMIVVNMITILIYTGMTAVVFKPAYVGVTIGLLILVFETSFIMVYKYKATGFKMQATVIVPMVVSICTMLFWVAYIFIYLVVDENEPDYFKQAAVVIAIAYFVFMVCTLIYIEFYSVDDIRLLTWSFWIIFAVTFLISSFGVGAALINFADQLLLGVVWIAICLYLVLNLLLTRYRTVIAILFTICFVGAGLVIMMSSDEDQNKSFEGISVFYLGMCILSFGYFFQAYAQNNILKRRSIFMNAPEVFPMLQYNQDSQQMKDANKEPAFFFFFIYVVMMWSFSATIIVDQQNRYIPMSIIGTALACAYIYIIEKNVEARTVDRKFFKQATKLFYTSCLVTAIEYKKKWRNGDREIKSTDKTAGSQHNDLNRQQEFANKTVYLSELTALDHWVKLIGKHQGELGFIGYLTSMGKTSNQETSEQKTESERNQSAQKELIEREAEENGTDNRAPPLRTMATADIQIKKDPQIDELDSKIISHIQQDESTQMVDTWCNIIQRAREEDYYDKKYWAFLNGYLNLKMAQLLENEMSIIETSIKMFIFDLKRSDPQILVDQNIRKNLLVDQLDENIDVTKFLLEMKKNHHLLTAFNLFLAKEFLKESLRNTQGNRIQPSNGIDGANGNVDQNLSDNIALIEQKFGHDSNDKFDMDNFQEESHNLISNMMANQCVDMMKAIEESQKRDEERDRQRRAAEEARLMELQQQQKRNIVKMNDDVQEVSANEDERLLKVQGDQSINAHRSSGRAIHHDDEFHEAKAKGSLQDTYAYVRINEIKSSENHREGTSTLVFSDGISANDIRQGALGDCYLLSAMSIIAHTRPELIKKIFHPESRKFRQEGIYTVMFYNGKVPYIITVDDQFFINQRSRRHAFCRLFNEPQTNEREIWPLLIEKAYAKFHGSYSNIDGGLVHTALEELTNGAGQSYKLRDRNVEQMFNTGEFWNKMKFWRQKRYLMGAGSPSGSDTDVSPLGIVQGHAYSILDVATIDGHNLIQLRNPWGEETEWKGSWGDNSDMWNERRKREVYKRMETQSGKAIEIGEADGIFWMSFNDFYLNFANLYLCRFFDKEYTELFTESEWSKANATAGGCTNNASVGFNPQMKLFVEPKNETIEAFMQLNVQGMSSQNDRMSIGFEIYDLSGKKVESRRIPQPLYPNDGGYRVTTTVTLDVALKSSGDQPFTVLITTFEPDVEAKFRFTIHYKHDQGKVKLEKFN